MARWPLGLALLLACLLPRTHSSGGGGGGGEAPPRSREAYVTLVYDESFLLGARVLGQSLRESGTSRWGGRAGWAGRRAGVRGNACLSAARGSTRRRPPGSRAHPPPLLGRAQGHACAAGGPGV
jgi:hypothetical protein